jgi:c(7)-type cytochrome triheme protein
MITHDPYTLKAIEYLVGLGSVLLFVAFWRFVTGAPAVQTPSAHRRGALRGHVALPADVVQDEMQTCLPSGFSQTQGTEGRGVEPTFSRDGADRQVGSGFSRIVVLALATLTLAVTLVAQDMPRLPGPIKMTRTGESPGQVIFTHAVHVHATVSACTACHPREFRILRASARRVPVTHAEMDKGRYCGACHDGKRVFGLDECAACHQD